MNLRTAVFVTASVKNTLVFHAGGTVSESALFPPGDTPNVCGVPGANQRNNGIGTWSFEPVAKEHSVHLRCNLWVNGIYHGYQRVDRRVVMSPDGMTISGRVRSIRDALDGSVSVDLCGRRDVNATV
jgi:hypothetical protein